MKLTPALPPPDFRASLAASYDAVAGHREEMGEADWRWPIAERFLDEMRREGKTRLLEIGAGVGYTARWFADRGIDVVATDLSPAQVALCRAKGLDAEVRDMYDLGFPPASFDAAWAMNCIHHVPNADLPEVLEGIREVLVPGGLLYIGVWGGRDMEGMLDDDFYPPSRFFAIRSDETLRTDLAGTFTVVEFASFLPEGERQKDGLHMQSAVLRAP